MLPFFWLNFLVKGGFFSFTKEDNSSDLVKRNDEGSEFSFLFLLLFFLQNIPVERDFLLKQFIPSG